MPTEEELRQRATDRLKKKRDLVGHVVAYVIVNLFLTLIWFFTGRGYYWPIWVLLGWGIGLAFNIWDVYGRRDISDADIDREVERMRRP